MTNFESTILNLTQEQKNFILQYLMQEGNGQTMVSQAINSGCFPKSQPDNLCGPGGQPAGSYGERRESAFSLIRDYVAKEPPMQGYSAIAEELGITRWYVSHYINDPVFLVGLPQSARHYCALLATYNAGNKRMFLHPSLQAILTIHTALASDMYPYTNHAVLWEQPAIGLAEAAQRDRYQYALARKECQNNPRLDGCFHHHKCADGCSVAAAALLVPKQDWDCISVQRARDILDQGGGVIIWAPVEYPGALLTGTVKERITRILGGYDE